MSRQQRGIGSYGRGKQKPHPSSDRGMAVYSISPCKSTHWQRRSLLTPIRMNNITHARRPWLAPSNMTAPPGADTPNTDVSGIAEATPGPRSKIPEPPLPTSRVHPMLVVYAARLSFPASRIPRVLLLRITGLPPWRNPCASKGRLGWAIHERNRSIKEEEKKNENKSTCTKHEERIKKQKRKSHALFHTLRHCISFLIPRPSFSPPVATKPRHEP